MKNQVLQEGHRKSQNFYHSDLILKQFLGANVEIAGELEFFFNRVGQDAATRMNKLSALADKYPPILNKRNPLGETIDEIEFHPAYWELVKCAVDSGMFQVKWNEKYRKKYQNHLHKIGFSLGFLYSMTECGIFCPLCMTDGAARLIDKFGTDEQKKLFLPKIGTQNFEHFITGAMFLTEKSGGSDVGANLVTATKVNENLYHLKGEKWFCSNANADLAFVLARTNPQILGTKGLSLFLVQKNQKNGSPNPKDIVRLKEKLGVKSMASAEIIFQNTEAELIGNEGDGFRLMTEMINLSRLYNAIAAIAAHRRAIIEAWQHLSFRTLFGKNALSQSMIQEDFYVLGNEWIADFYLTMKTVELLDSADNGGAQSASLLRIFVPIVKMITAENAYRGIQKSMELMGGIGYIEENITPRLMRDALVLPIWEGSGNIIFLDMWRAIQKTNALIQLKEYFQIHLTNSKLLPLALQLIANLQIVDNERKMRNDFRKMIDLLKITVLLEKKQVLSSEYFLAKWLQQDLPEFHKEHVEQVIGWKF